MIVDATEKDPLFARVPDGSDAFPSESPAEVVDEIRPEYGSVSNDGALVVIHDGLFRRFSGEKRNSRVLIIRERPAPEKGVIAIRRELIVRACDVVVVVLFDRPAEPEPGIVVAQTIAL